MTMIYRIVCHIQVYDLDFIPTSPAVCFRYKALTAMLSKTLKPRPATFQKSQRLCDEELGPRLNFTRKFQMQIP